MRFIVAALLLCALPANAHGPAQWIQDGLYKNAVGELCCGVRDCGLYVGGTIEHVAGGYKVNADFQIGEGEQAKIIHIDAFIKDENATPSPTGDYWLCSWSNEIKCFFVPILGM